MNVIFKNATILDQESPFHNQKVDLIIENGVIVNIGTDLSAPADYQKVEADNLHLSQGWFDSSVSFGEPGFEDRENIANGLTTAAKSGFTNVALQPNTFPVIDNQSQVSFLLNKSANFATELHPIGALTKNSEGVDLAEMYDMKNAGAVAFGDYCKSLDNANLLKIGLQYVQDFDGLVIAFSQNKTVKGNGVVHEGLVSTRLGLKGIPSLAEELDVARNLFLLEYTGGKLHIPTVSTGRSVQLIREAKAKGLQVSCSVTVHNLVLTDDVLNGFDSRYKVSPPLRDENNRKALIEGVLDGTIDMITSDHNPLDIELKKMEFDNAKNGTIGLESAFGALMTVLPADIIIDKLVSGKKVFGIETKPIKVGAKASLTLFNPEGNWEFTKNSILSKSKNSAFLGQTLKGRAYGIYNNGQLILS